MHSYAVSLTCCMSEKERNEPLELLYLTEVSLRSFIKARCKGGDAFQLHASPCMAFSTHSLTVLGCALHFRVLDCEDGQQIK